MNRHFRLASLALAGGILAASLGCGGGPKPVAVSGRVTLDGQPLAGASVRFLPEDPASANEARGVTGTDGVFRLSWRESNDGALPGTYKVVISKTEAGKSLSDATTAPKTMDDMKGVYGKMASSMTEKKTTRSAPKSLKNLIPTQYGEREMTPLTTTVPSPSGKYEFDLRSAGG